VRLAARTVDGATMTTPEVRECIRDFLAASGPTLPADLAAACAVPLGVVMAELDRGALRPASARAGGQIAHMPGPSFHASRVNRRGRA
jgi:hypothetical protein